MPDHSLSDLTRLDPSGTAEAAVAARADAERRLQALQTQLHQLSGRVAQLEQERALLAEEGALEHLVRAWRAEHRADAQHLPPYSLEERRQHPPRMYGTSAAPVHLRAQRGLRRTPIGGRMSKPMTVLAVVEGSLMVSLPWVVQAGAVVRLVVGALLVLLGAALGVAACASSETPND